MHTRVSFRELKSVIVIENNNAKQGGDDRWIERRIETCDLDSAGWVMMFLSSHTATLFCTHIQVILMHTHASRDTQAHKELCATKGVGVIVNYRWWQQGHMPMHFNFFSTAIRVNQGNITQYPLQSQLWLYTKSYFSVSRSDLSFFNLLPNCMSLHWDCKPLLVLFVTSWPWCVCHLDEPLYRCCVC